MDRFRRRRTHARVSSPIKVTTIVDRTSENWIPSSHRQGNELVGKNNKLLKLASRSNTWSSIEILEENQLSFDLGRVSGTPMKKLLADEMAKETESGRRSPSIIARLMGLDGLPASHNTNKKQKRLSDSHQRGSSSPGASKNCKFQDRRSHRKCAVGQQWFKDVYEVKDRSYMETRSNTSLAASNRSYNEDEIGFIRQKFVEAKRFYTDENFQHSKEFQDTIDVLNSNKDLLLRFLQEPDSLFSKHLQDLHHVPESYYGVGTNSNTALKCNIDVIGSQIAGEACRKIDINNSRKHRTNYFSNMYDKHSIDLCKLNILAEGQVNASSDPTKIVVLKPNLGKAINITKSTPAISPRELQSDFELTPEDPVVDVRSKRSKDDNSDSYGRKSRESRELAREITCLMKNKLGRDSLYFSSSGSKGYSADESSHDTSENESSSESEVTIVSSRTSSNRTLRNKSSSLRYMESSVNIEAKKRLSERWKMTHRSQEIGESSKGSTLAEMLAIPDVDIRTRCPDTTAAQDVYSCRFERNDGMTELFSSPLGISSRDGWKGGYIQNLSRSRSVPNSANHFGSAKSSSKCDAITAEKFLIRKENIGYVRNTPVKRDFRRKDALVLKNKKSSDGKCRSFCPVEGVDDIFEVQASGNLLKNIIDGKDSPEVKTVILETPSGRHDTCLATHEVPAQESHSCASPQNGSSSSGIPSLPQVAGASCLQCTATHLESPVSSKESEQPSPVSILEAPFVEDLSSGSECFERVSAELNGLRMQLQLLKQESEVYEEGSMVLSSDEFADERTELCDDKCLTHLGESWETWYLVDVLALSGLDKINCEFFLAARHSQDCPIAPWVFEDLEKRYSELESYSRSERKLLYDSINARIMEIAQQFVDMEPWVKKQGKSVNPQRLREALKIELQKVVDKHENKAKENELDIMILSNMGWMMLEEHVSAIGRDIEAWLIDELVSETLDV